MTDKSNTHAVRRTKYGLNVTVAVVAALVLVVLLNWIAYRQTYARWDLTATRAYSLAPQTRQVLNDLDGEYRIVTLFGDDMEELNRIRDLADEYGRRSGQVRVEHLDPTFDVRRREQLNIEVRTHFADEIGPYVEAIDHGMAALRQTSERMPLMSAKLSDLLEDETFAVGTVRERVQQINAVVGGQQSALTDQLQALAEASDQSLPAYREIKQTVQQLLEGLEEGLFRAGVQWFDQAVNSGNLPNHVANTLLQVQRDLEALRSASRAALRELRLAEMPRRYDEARQGLSIQQTVVVLGPGELRVIPASAMYPDHASGQATGEVPAESRFLGEERLTGALIAMGLEQPPMVVFVNAARQPALGEQGLYQQVAERLRSANVRVEQWSPGGRMSTTGQSLPASPPPRAEPGQSTVWVVLPLTESNPMAGGAGKGEVAELLNDRLAKGDAAMVMLMLDPMAHMDIGDPIVDLLREGWGIRPQLERQILREVQLANGQTQATGRFEVDRWPDALPISQALRGQRGMFVQTSPLATADVEGVQHWPVVELRGQRTWAARGVQTAEGLRGARYDAAEAEESYTVAVAAERDGTRLITFADPVWASDMITTYGDYGASFPANSELFVNSVYWLAELEGLIAASPRTQDIRRIHAMGESTLRGYYFGLLGGVPALILGVGVGVWFVRRRG